jgi:hypothetical protein
MKVRTIVLLIVILLLLGGAALAQSSEPPPVQYAVAQGVASGGLYRLTSQVWRVRGVADGDGYHLTVLLEPTGTGTPCCCSYLPCMLKGD